MTDEELKNLWFDFFVNHPNIICLLLLSFGKIDRIDRMLEIEYNSL